MIGKDLRKATGYIFATAALAASAVMMGGSAQAAEGTVDAEGEYAGCPTGAVCVYPGAHWNGGEPEHIYYSYGGHNLEDEFGTHRIFNNQHSGATAHTCTGYDGGGDCSGGLKPWTYSDKNLTPINSIKLSR